MVMGYFAMNSITSWIVSQSINANSLAYIDVHDVEKIISFREVKKFISYFFFV